MGMINSTFMILSFLFVSKPATILRPLRTSLSGPCLVAFFSSISPESYSGSFLRIVPDLIRRLTGCRLTPLVRTHTPPYRGTYAVLTGLGILVKKLLLALEEVFPAPIDE